MFANTHSCDIQVARPEARDFVCTEKALTEREWQVLRLVVAGQRNREIADTLVLSENTVKMHVSMLLQKLGGGSRHALVAYAMQYHLEL